MAMNYDNVPSGFDSYAGADKVVNWVGFCVSSAGAVQVIDGKGVTTTIQVAAGQTVMGRISKILAAGTTVTSANITGFVAG